MSGYTPEPGAAPPRRNTCSGRPCSECSASQASSARRRARPLPLCARSADLHAPGAAGCSVVAGRDSGRHALTGAYPFLGFLWTRKAWAACKVAGHLLHISLPRC